MKRALFAVALGIIGAALSSAIAIRFRSPFALGVAAFFILGFIVFSFDQVRFANRSRIRAKYAAFKGEQRGASTRIVL